jgi:hypothetical protein
MWFLFIYRFSSCTIWRDRFLDGGPANRSAATSASVTAAPASAKALGVARPMPEAAPVTRATVSLKDQFTTRIHYARI